MNFYKWLRRQRCEVCDQPQKDGAQLVSVFGKTSDGERMGLPIPLCDSCVIRFLSQTGEQMNGFFKRAQRYRDTYDGIDHYHAPHGARGQEACR